MSKSRLFKVMGKAFMELEKESKVFIFERHFFSCKI